MTCVVTGLVKAVTEDFADLAGVSAASTVMVVGSGGNVVQRVVVRGNG